MDDRRRKWVWLRREFPWCDGGFIYAIAEDYADTFVGSLAALGFTTVSIRPTTELEFREQVHAVLRFPEGYGRSWDSWHDGFRDFDFPHPFALIWRDADKMAAAYPKLFGEACAFLHSEFRELGQSHGHGLQAVLVITGSGSTFKRP